MEASTTGISNRPLAVSVGRAAELLGLSRTTVWGFVRSGNLTSARLGRRVLVPVSSIEKLLREATRV
jgi:excisionase family DNA binding protein